MNPFIPINDYTPDGEPHVFGNRIYLFPSHDKRNGTTFCMLDYVFYSASLNDLSTWTNPGVAYSVTQDPFYKPNRGYAMYAPDVVQGKSGRYYLYYCLSGDKGQYGYSFPISVAVSNYPDHGYKFLGYVKNKDGSVFVGKYCNFDPSLMNDDGVIRLYFGAYYPWKIYHFPKFMIRKINKMVFNQEEILTGPYTITLEDDMLTIKDEPKLIISEEQECKEFKKHPFFEASSIRKFGDLYYFIYSSWYNHELCYATSKSPDKDFHYQGILVSNGDIGIGKNTIKRPARAIGNNHGSVEKINGEYYVFYHKQTHNTSYSRQACVEKIQMDENGLFKQAECTISGFKDSLEANQKYPASICTTLNNGKKAPLNRNGNIKGFSPYIFSNKKEQFITNVGYNTKIGYKYFYVSKECSLFLSLKGTFKGKIKIYINNELTECKAVDLNTNDYSLIEFKINKLNKIDLLIKFNGKGSLDFNYLEFKE